MSNLMLNYQYYLCRSNSSASETINYACSQPSTIRNLLSILVWLNTAWYEADIAMATTTCIILLGIFAFTYGIPASNKNYNSKQGELLKRLEDFFYQGNYDIALSHHEDSPKNHHEDRSISYQHGKPSDTLNEGSNYEANPGSPGKHGNGFNLFHNNEQHTRSSNHSGNASCMQKWADCKDVLWRLGYINTNYDYDNVGEILAILQEYEKMLRDNGIVGVRLRCLSNKCNGVDEENDDTGSKNIISNYYNNLRCRGKSCSRSRDYRQDRDDDDDRNDGYHLRCAGNRCGRDRDDRDRDDRDDRNNLRCVGNRCGRSRDYRDDDDRYDRGNLRCVGDRCARSRDDRSDDYRSDRYSLRCVGNRCGRSRDYRADDDRDDRYDRYDRGYLRCVGDRCGRSRDYRADDYRSDKNSLRSKKHKKDKSTTHKNEFYRDDRNSLRISRDGYSNSRIHRDGYYRGDRDSLRCEGDTCGRKENIENYIDNSYKELRCVGNRCTRTRHEDEDGNLIVIGRENSDEEFYLSELVNSIITPHDQNDDKTKKAAAIDGLLQERKFLIKKLKNLMSTSKV